MATYLRLTMFFICFFKYLIFLYSLYSYEHLKKEYFKRKNSWTFFIKNTYRESNII